jgi:MarR family transcriptional regulator, organic hydroperoxide resistance regulator
VGEEVERVASDVAVLFPAIYRRFHPDALSDGALTPRMLVVLQHLLGAGPLTLGELAEQLGAAKPSMTELVTRLESRAFVARLRDDRDRRRVFVWLTDLGQARAESSLQVLDPAALAKAISAMAPGDRARLVRGMRALVQAEQDRPASRPHHSKGESE